MGNERLSWNRSSGNALAVPPVVVRLNDPAACCSMNHPSVGVFLIRDGGWPSMYLCPVAFYVAVGPTSSQTRGPRVQEVTVIRPRPPYRPRRKDRAACPGRRGEATPISAPVPTAPNVSGGRPIITRASGWEMIPAPHAATAAVVDVAKSSRNSCER